jgi:hypothetical protein
MTSGGKREVGMEEFKMPDGRRYSLELTGLLSPPGAKLAGATETHSGVDFVSVMVRVSGGETDRVYDMQVPIPLLLEPQRAGLLPSGPDRDYWERFAAELAPTYLFDLSGDLVASDTGGRPAQIRVRNGSDVESACRGAALGRDR